MSGWGTHVHAWLIHVNVRQKPLQYCKVISLQLKFKRLKEIHFLVLFYSCALVNINTPVDVCLRRELLGHLIDICLYLIDSSKQFSNMFLPLYTFTSNV